MAPRNQTQTQTVEPEVVTSAPSSTPAPEAPKGPGPVRRIVSRIVGGRAEATRLSPQLEDEFDSMRKDAQNAKEFKSWVKSMKKERPEDYKAWKASCQKKRVEVKAGITKKEILGWILLTACSGVGATAGSWFLYEKYNERELAS